MQWDPQWVIAAASCISALAIIVAVIQINIAKKNVSISQKSLDEIANQIKLAKQVYVDSHDLERRKKAIILLKDWSIYLSDHGTAAKDFLSKLDKDQCMAILKEKEVIVDAKYKDYLERNITGIGEIGIDEDCGGREIKLTRSQSSLVRRQGASYLNMLETILSASRNGIADKEMIKEQFANLVMEDIDKPIMYNFRQGIGGIDAFPSIHSFVGEIISQYKVADGKKQLGVES